MKAGLTGLHVSLKLGIEPVLMLANPGHDGAGVREQGEVCDHRWVGYPALHRLEILESLLLLA